MAKSGLDLSNVEGIAVRFRMDDTFDAHDAARTRLGDDDHLLQPHFGKMFATERARTSFEPPGAKRTTTWLGLVGNVSVPKQRPAAISKKISAKAMNKMNLRVRFMYNSS